MAQGLARPLLDGGPDPHPLPARREFPITQPSDNALPDPFLPPTTEPPCEIVGDALVRAIHPKSGWVLPVAVGECAGGSTDDTSTVESSLVAVTIGIAARS